MTNPAASPAPARLTPRPNQQAAIHAGTRQLRPRHSRALITSACGTGKTLTAIRIAENLGADRILNVFPTLDLLAQTALAWRTDHRTEPMVALSSMDADAHEGLRAANVGGTSDPKGLARALAVLPRLTVFTTYASLEKIEETQHQGIDVPPFDLAIMDEAHRVSGRADKTWAIAHDAKRIRADRRLYLTATPRIWDSPDLTESPDSPRPRLGRARHLGPQTLHIGSSYSMDDPAVFGPRIHDYPLAEAITDGVLADYQILVPTITDTQLRTQLNTHDTTTDGRRTTALHLAVTKAINDHQLDHVLVYFNEVDAATRFAREYPHTLRRLPPELRPTRTPQVSAIHGDHTPEERQQILADFAQAECAILTNAKLLAEGIDIRSIDGIVFADTTRSVVRCIQALGRALRKPADSPKISSLIIPAYVAPDADPTDLLGTAYEPVWAIAFALRSHDHRILDRLPNRAHRLSTETSQVIASRWHFDFDINPEAVARAMDLIAFDPRGPQTRTRRRGLAALQRFHDTYGHADVPVDYVDAYGFTTGSFVEQQRDAYRRGQLANDPEWVAELEALGIAWNAKDAAWRTNLATISSYHRQHGHLAIPKTEPGGAFLADQRSLASRGELDQLRQRELAALDPDWQLPHSPDWTRKYHVLRAYIQTGNDSAAISQDTVIGSVKAGNWLQRQLVQWEKLTAGQRELLTKIHLTPQTLSLLSADRRQRRSFAQNVAIVGLFVRREGRFPGARDWITMDGERVMIGPWLAKTRTKHRAGELAAAQAGLMESQFGTDWTTAATPSNLSESKGE
ncbi:DEAD/DEAH box helicase [Streptacidiphilus fuscans]|uniref:Helicase associated domain protein n=1 Tax=Streptacidiphilus fuscans TaxID=2789292 RepID=A0A931BCW8_9ACTN|nr:DEAD/DEAH box helicase [Streptacidiphilus fuscans]MBF9073912.1 Helicase associated domain protein [Streptacidiphilus fuscans]